MYHIHPLPTRFGKSAHIIVESSNPIPDHLNTEHYNHQQRQTPLTHDKQPLQRPNTFCTMEQETEYNLNNNNSLNNSDGSSDGDKINERSDRLKRFISGTDKVPRVLHIETAIFVDKDLYRHMTKNYPKDTESNLIRFVLAMINGVIFVHM